MSGACLSLCANLFGLLYLVQSLLILFQYKGTLYTSSQEERYFDADLIYPLEENGLQFAFGIADLSNLRAHTTDTKYTLEELYNVHAIVYNSRDDGTVTEIPIDLHECSEAELGID